MDAPRLFPALDRVRGWGLRFSSQGHQLAIIGDDGLSVLDRRTGGVMTAPIPAWAGYYTSALRWTACGLRIHGRNRVLDLDLAHGELRWRSQTGGTHSEGSLEPTSDASGDRVVFLNADVPTIGDQDGVLRQLQPTPPHRGKSTRGGEAQATFSPDGRWLMIQQVFAEDAVCFDVWDAQSGLHRFREYLPGFGTMLLVVDGQEHILLESHHSQYLHLVDLDRGARLTLHCFEHARVFAGSRGKHLVFVTSHQQLHAVATGPLIQRLAQVGNDEVSAAALGPEAVLWSVKATTNTSACALDELQDRVVTSAPGQLDIRRLSDGAVVRSLVTGLGVAEIAVSSRGLACLWQNELQVWNSGGVLVACVLLLKTGAIVLVGGQFQRLRTAKNEPAPLEGLFGRVGVTLWPLEKLASLESDDLCSTLWRGLRDG